MHCVLLVHPLCAPCATSVQPLCNSLRNPLFWPLRNLGPFEIDLGYCSTRSKDTAPQNQKILLLTQRKSWWDTAPQVQKILLHTLRRRWKILLHCFFWVILPRSLFFQRADREGSDQKFFLPRVPKFKSVQTGWLHDLSFYPPFTQVQEITVKDRTIVTGHPVEGKKKSSNFNSFFHWNKA